MKKIAITGSIGAGKSHIVKLLNEQHGIPVFNCDKEARKLQEEDPYTKNAIIQWLGHSVYDFGEVDVKAMGEALFGNDANLKRMEALIAGPIMANFHKFCYEHQYRMKDKVPFVLYENAILMNNKSYATFDGVIVVDADTDIRLERVMTNRGVSEEYFNSRNNKQRSVMYIRAMLENKRVPDFVIKNNGGDLDLKELIDFCTY